nr:hypothetical protein [Marinobacter sp. AC-23]
MTVSIIPFIDGGPGIRAGGWRGRRCNPLVNTLNQILFPIEPLHLPDAQRGECAKSQQRYQGPDNKEGG